MLRQPDHQAPEARINKVARKSNAEESIIKNPVVHENYRRLFCTALFIALKERPLDDFSDLIHLQKKNGLKCFEGKNHVNACGDFIDYLADTLREDLKQILKTVSLFSLAMDGSQPRKRNLSMQKLSFEENLLSWFLKCIHMNEFGGSADDLKAALDALMREYGRDDRYAKRQWGDKSITTYTALASNYSLCKSQIGACN